MVGMPPFGVERRNLFYGRRSVVYSACLVLIVKYTLPFALTARLTRSINVNEFTEAQQLSMKILVILRNLCGEIANNLFQIAIFCDDMTKITL